jgi:hypothetical protein
MLAREPLGINARYSSAEFEKIKGGHRAPSMDEKWDLMLDGSELFMCRSWTGTTIYQIEFIPDGLDWVIRDSWVNRDPSQYKLTDSEFDRELSLWLIDALLLKKKVAPPKMPSQRRS